MASYSHLQEYPVTVHDVEKEPPGDDIGSRLHHGQQMLGEEGHHATQQAVTHETETDEARQHVDGYGVHADDHKEEVPTAPFPYIYNIIEEGQHDERIASHGTYEGAGPQGLVDGCLEAPQITRCAQHDAGCTQGQGLARACETFTLGLDPSAGKHAQQGRAYGRNGGEQSLGIVVGTITMGSKQGAVNIAGYVSLTCQSFRSRHVGGHEQTGYQAVAHQQTEDDEHEMLHPGHMHVDEGTQHPGHADASQHAPEPQFGKLEIEYAVAHPAQGHEYEASHHHLAQDGYMAHASLLLLLQGERKRGTGYEEEQGEDGVVMPETVPLGMGHLLGYGLPRGTLGEETCNGCDEGGTSHDEQHVKASQGIE